MLEKVVPQRSKLRSRRAGLSLSIVASMVSSAAELRRPVHRGSCEEYDGGLLILPGETSKVPHERQGPLYTA